jgi:WD40 repeat protein/tRNA A-37 threonylcarbamoyl transferase component Bud32
MNWSKPRYAQISKLLDEALELEPGTRGAWLESLERRDPGIALELRELLEPAADSAAARILAAAGELANQLSALPEAEPSLVGRRFGPYCVRSLIGHGGMATVWLAERVDGQFERRVALKLAQQAFMTRGLTERLLRERAILASLDHPNIARLYDTGVSDDGQPYLALEYVAGVPLTTYCDNQQLSVQGRLDLFDQVLNAVHYAHAHLVIHRDLKPSNILVTAEGRVCLLDFGIAKLFTADTAKETELTQLTGRALSLAYAAPEQIAGSPITIAADIYSLGVMLYELLVGQRPYKLPRHSRGALEEAILWTDPTSLTRAQLDESAASVRSTSMKRLARTVRGDLNTIVLKALHKSPRDRYATVDALREDLRRWRTGEPVLAQPNSLLYRTRKFVRRHWVGVCVGAAFSLTLLAGLAATTYEVRVAERQRDIAISAQLGSLTQAAAARLKEGDVAGASGITVEILKRWGIARAAGVGALTVFQEARAADLQILALDGRVIPKAAGVNFSPNGMQFLTGDDDGTAEIRDVATGHRVISLRSENIRLYTGVYSADGRRVVTISNDNIPRIWEAATGRQILALVGHTDRTWSAEFSPDGKRIVTTSWDRTARIWDSMTGKELLQLRHGDKVFSARYSPDGARVITGSHDAVARVWDAVRGREMLRLTGHNEGVSSVAFSPDGHRIATASGDGAARLWDAETGGPISSMIGHRNAINDIQFSRDGRKLITASEDRTARIWDANYAQQTDIMMHPAEVFDAALSPDGRYVATTSSDGTVRLWSASAGSDCVVVLDHPEQVSSAAFSPDGRRILTASFDKTAVIWDATSGHRLMTLRGHEDRVWWAAFSYDGRRIVTGSRDRTARVWDADTGAQLFELRGHTGGVEAAAFSPDGNLIATGAHDSTVRIWNAKTGQLTREIKGHGAEVVAAVFAPDSRRVLSASIDKTARIWDAGSGRELLRLQGHTATVEAARFSADGRLVVTASDDKTARVWDAANGRELLRLTRNADGLAGVGFSADGRRIVTAGQDGSVRVWDGANGDLLTVYAGHHAEVRSAVFSPDGRLILTASSDNTARVWNARIPSLEQQRDWTEAAQFDPLSSDDRAALGFTVSSHKAARAPSQQPDRLAKSGEQAYDNAYRAETQAQRNAYLLEAFRLFALAAAQAEGENWPDASWREWRHRRASLARLLARAGMMQDVADVFATVTEREPPQSQSLWQRFISLYGTE